MLQGWSKNLDRLGVPKERFENHWHGFDKLKMCWQHHVKIGGDIEDVANYIFQLGHLMPLETRHKFEVLF